MRGLKFTKTVDVIEIYDDVISLSQQAKHKNVEH